MAPDLSFLNKVNKLLEDVYDENNVEQKHIHHQIFNMIEGFLKLSATYYDMSLKNQTGVLNKLKKENS
jgi:hypothetical protein